MENECDDEEGRFSAVQGTGAYRNKEPGQAGWGGNSAPRANGRGNQAPLSQIPPMPEDR